MFVTTKNNEILKIHKTFKAAVSKRNNRADQRLKSSKKHKSINTSIRTSDFWQILQKRTRKTWFLTARFVAKNDVYTSHAKSTWYQTHSVLTSLIKLPCWNWHGKYFFQRQRILLCQTVSFGAFSDLLSDVNFCQVNYRSCQSFINSIPNNSSLVKLIHIIYSALVQTVLTTYHLLYFLQLSQT